MTVDVPVTLVWLAPESPDGEQSRALTAWARAHGVRLGLPHEEKPPRTISVDARLAEDVEKLLDRVRDAIAGRDADAADRGLAAAESALRAHPELPQASFLMAEVERARSSRFRRVPPLDEEAADRAWLRAEALDGGRVAGVAEGMAAGHPADAAVALDPLPVAATLWVDGRTAPSGLAVLSTRAGPHALVVTWDSAPIWAGWIEAPAGSSTVHIAIPTPPPCSSGDVGLAHLVGGAVAAEQVRCHSWVAALPGPRPASVLLATCEGGGCGTLLEWSAPSPGSWAWTPPARPVRTGWPTWATWGLVGAGAVVATGVVLVASGVLQPSPTETRFVSGGVRAQ